MDYIVTYITVQGGNGQELYFYCLRCASNIYIYLSCKEYGKMVNRALFETAHALLPYTTSHLAVKMRLFYSGLNCYKKQKSNSALIYMLLIPFFSDGFNVNRG